MNIFKRTPRFSDYAAEFLAWSQTNQRDATYRLHRQNIQVLRAYFGQRRLARITPAMIEAFKVHRKADRRRGNRWRTPLLKRQSVSAVSVNRALTTLSRLFNHAIRSGEFHHLRNPVCDVSKFPEFGSMRVISREEEVRYFAAICSQDLWDVSRLILETGMRPHEVLGLRVTDIDFPHRAVLVANRERLSPCVVLGKTPSAIRSIPLSGEARIILKTRAAAVSNCREAFIFPSGCAGYVKSVRHAHNRSIARAGISPSFRLYDLRHTFATRAAQAGVSLPVLSALLGHTSIQMTMRYVHPQEGAKRDAIHKLELLNLAS